MSAAWFNGSAPVTRRVRAYFAPVNRVAQAPVLFDPSQQGGGFDLDTPPSPWISLGFIQNFTRKSTSRTAPISAGIPQAPQAQVRESRARR